MKFRNSFAILAMSAAFLLAACGGGGQPQSSTPESSPVESSDVATRYTVTFDVDGGSSVPAQTVEAGQKATRPSNPVKMGFDFDDWYRDPAKTMAFDFDSAINANITLYAKWIAAAQSSDSTPEEEDDVLYFRDVSWWNNMGGETAAKFDTYAGENEFGEVMTYVSYHKTNKYRYAKIDVPEDATSVTFYRVYMDTTEQVYKYGDNFTVTVQLSDAGENDMYDISGAGASWVTGPIEGVWGVYDPTDVDGGDDPVTPSGDELDEITTKYGLRDVDTGKYLCALEMSAEKDHQGRDQASALGVSFKTGVKFQLYDTENSAGWIVPVEGWSLGGSSADDTKYLEYFSVGADYWEVIQDFTGDVYAKFKMNDDGIYFGLSA